MKRYWDIFYKNHFEWFALAACLLIAGVMNPYVNQGPSLCFFEMMGFHFCPGHGLAHSIAFTFRGDWTHAVKANMMGPIAIIILSGRIIYLWKRAFLNPKN